MDNQQGPTVQHRKLCSMLCGSLDSQRAEVLERMVTYVSMVESRCLSSWNYHNILISYTPIHNKKLKKNSFQLTAFRLEHNFSMVSSLPVCQSAVYFKFSHSLCVYLYQIYVHVCIHACAHTHTHTHISCWFCFSREMFVMKDTIFTMVAVELRLLKTKHRISLCKWMDCNTGWTSTLTGCLLKEVRS